MITELVHQKNCKSYTMITDFYTGEITYSCGSVSSERSVDSGVETLVHSSGEYQSNNKVGQKISLKMIDRGLSTIIESKNRDGIGKLLSDENRRMFYRLRMWDRNQLFIQFNKIISKCIHSVRWYFI